MRNDKPEVVGDVEQDIEYRRLLHESDFPNRIVKQRAIEANIVFTGLDADLPDGTTEVQIFFATDVNKLYAWNGTAWKSVTLS